MYDDRRWHRRTLDSSLLAQHILTKLHDHPVPLGERCLRVFTAPERFLRHPSEIDHVRLDASCADRTSAGSHDLRQLYMY